MGRRVRGAGQGLITPRAPTRRAGRWQGRDERKLQSYLAELDIDGTVEIGDDGVVRVRYKAVGMDSIRCRLWALPYGIKEVKRNINAQFAD